MKADDLAYLHRGQRITMPAPPALNLSPGDRVDITFDAPHAWRMPARVLDVDVVRGTATIEPGASVKHPAKWRLVFDDAPIVPAVGVRVPQFDLFGALA